MVDCSARQTIINEWTKEKEVMGIREEYYV